MTAPVAIRQYEPRDANAVIRCITVLQDTEHDLEADRLPGASIASAYFEQIVQSCARQSGRIFVAERDDTVVGFVCIWLEHDSETLISTMVDYAYVSDLVVLPTYRRQGIGAALLSRAEEYARECGITTLKIGVLVRNTPAHAVYRRVGFRDYEVILIKALDKQPPHT
jgi:ribosomal protein S18 acetylase RimI-like enzyme